jgi:uncharacterized protein with GYD domain
MDPARKEESMATHIMLLRFTQKGIQNIKDGPTRVAAARKTFEGLGARLKDFYLVTGQYDAVVVAEAPDDATMAKASLAISSLGNVRIETLRAFTEGEYRDLISALP